MQQLQQARLHWHVMPCLSSSSDDTLPCSTSSSSVTCCTAVDQQDACTADEQHSWRQACLLSAIKRLQE
jgi:hypothetical protein